MFGLPLVRPLARLARTAPVVALLAGMALNLALPAVTSAALPQAPYRLSVSDVSLLEGNAGTRQAVFTVTMRHPGPGFVAPPGQVFLSYQTVAGTAAAGGDYTSASSSLIFNAISARAATKTVSVTVRADTVDEGDEQFALHLFNQSANAAIADADGAATIRDDDPLPTVGGLGDSALEGNAGINALFYTVTLSHPVGETVRVAYLTVAGTATANADYAPTTGTLTFTPGQTSKRVSVAAKGDLIDEGDETVFLRLGNAVNATIPGGLATLTGLIVDDDPLPRLRINDVARSEPSGGLAQMTFTVTLTHAVGEAVTVAYRTANGTAVATGDYASEAASLTIPAGQTSRTLTIGIRADALDENDEVFFVNLGAAVNAVTVDAQGIGTIIDAP